VLVVAPTRELTLQISGVCNKLKKAVPVRAVAVYGGASQEEQEEALAQHTSQALLVIGTPGRLLAVLESGALQLDRCAMLVLDEADRMLALGFEEQLSTIREALPDKDSGRQTLLFSATFPKAVRAIGKTWLRKGFETVKIDSEKATVPKDDDDVNVHMAIVEQTVHVCAEHKKSRKLMKYITKLRAEDGRARSRVLVFANRIKTVQFIADLCKRHNEKVSTLHGTMKQNRRDQALKDFKAGKTPVLIATDVAGRGLDIAGLEYVVNWDFPGSIEQYRHRVGRAGRQGKKGAALSFFTRKFTPLASDLVKLLEKDGHFVDPNLRVLAKVAEALPKPSAKSVTNADRYDDSPADEHGELERDDDDDDDATASAARDGGERKHADDVRGSDDEGDEDIADALQRERESKSSWWNNDKGGRGRVFKTKKGDVVATKRKVTVGPGDDELQKRKKERLE
jgi:ATP-dependent RNA helicase DDX5/DBP2